MTYETIEALGITFQDAQEYYGITDRYNCYTPPGIVAFCTHGKHRYLLGRWPTISECLKDLRRAYSESLRIHDGTLSDLQTDLYEKYPRIEPTQKQLAHWAYQEYSVKMEVNRYHRFLSLSRVFRYGGLNEYSSTQCIQ